MKPCEACGAWWLPGSEKCPAHRKQDCEHPITGAPRVYASIPLSYGDMLRRARETVAAMARDIAKRR
jgi:hypothetical protein